MGAGAFMLAVMADLAGGRRYRLVSAIGAFVAPWPVIAGVLLLVVDLGVPWRFWEMLLRRGEGILMFNPTSTMSIGTWLLTIFVWVSLGYIVVTILAYPFRWVGTLRKVVGVIGLPLALLITIYTGVLLSASPNPLWNTILLPIAFVVSAMVTGIASVIFILAILRFCGVGAEEEHIPKLEKLNSRIIAFQLVMVILFMLVRIGSAQMISMIGTVFFGFLWWIGIIALGLVVPLVLTLKGQARKPLISLALSALVLLGGFLLRYVILVAGQMA